MTTSSPTGHETPEEKASLQAAFTGLARSVGRSGDTGQRIAHMIAERRARRDDTTRED